MSRLRWSKTWLICLRSLGLALEIHPEHAAELVELRGAGDSLFDGIDFGALDTDGDGEVAIEPASAAHNVLAKTLVRHDHWGMEVR